MVFSSWSLSNPLCGLDNKHAILFYYCLRPGYLTQYVTIKCKLSYNYNKIIYIKYVLSRICDAYYNTELLLSNLT